MMYLFSSIDLMINFFVFFKEFRNRPDTEIRDFVCNVDVSLVSLKKHALATYELYKRGGLDWMIKDNYRVRNHLEYLMKEATIYQNWLDLNINFK